MSVKIDENFKEDILIDNLKKHGKDGRWFTPVVEFVFTKYANDLFQDLNDEFSSTKGASAYDRRKLFLAMSYASIFDVDHDLTKVSRLCRTDHILGEIMGGDTPCGLTFDNFLKKSNPRVMKKLSICTVMEINDLEEIDFSTIYTDSSESKINGSVHYKINQDDVVGLEFMNEHKLLHNRSHKQMKKNRRKLEKLKEKYSDDTEKQGIIKHILKNFSIYDKRLYNKLDELKEYLDDDKESYVCVMFPEAKFLRSKRGKYEFGLLVQETMLNNGIILNSLAQSEPNDSKALEEIILDLKDTFKILLDLQIMYGERENYKEIYDALTYALHILDSGYFTNENLESAYFHNMKVLIMPRTIARSKNDKLRERLPDDPDEFIKEIKKITLREMERLYNNYKCPFGITTELIDIVDVNSEFNRKRKNMDDVCKEKRYLYHIDCPCFCPYIDICSKTDFEVKMTPLANQMINKFTQKRNLKKYAKRFGANEQIHGYLKHDKGMMKLAGSNKQAAQNHLYIKMITYNIKHKVNLKGTNY